MYQLYHLAFKHPLGNKTKYNPTHFIVVFDAAAQTDRQAEHNFIKPTDKNTG